MTIAECKGPFMSRHWRKFLFASLFINAYALLTLIAMAKHGEITETKTHKTYTLSVSK